MKYNSDSNCSNLGRQYGALYKQLKIYHEAAGIEFNIPSIFFTLVRHFDAVSLILGTDSWLFSEKEIFAVENGLQRNCQMF